MVLLILILIGCGKVRNLQLYLHRFYKIQFHEFQKIDEKELDVRCFKIQRYIYIYICERFVLDNMMFQRANMHACACVCLLACFCMTMPVTSIRFSLNQ